MNIEQNSLNHTNATSSAQPATEPSSVAKEDKDTLAMWIAICTCFVVLIFGIMTFQWYRKKQMSGKNKRKAKLKKLKKEREKERNAVKRVSIAPIKRDVFLYYFGNHIIKEDGSGSLHYEIKALEAYAVCPASTVGSSLCNEKKNYHPDFIPFDYNRVTLSCVDNDPHSDYINASYIYNNPDDVNTGAQAKYIAAQSPLKNTVNDFWRMVWQEECKCIVMLSDVFTYARQECVKYWPDTSGVYGSLTVKQKGLQKTLHHTIREFMISQEVDGVKETKHVRQYQLHDWVTDVQPDVTGVLDLRRKVVEFTKDNDSIPIIHSGTGSGRVGVYIVLDVVLERLEKEDTVDVLGSIIDLRRSRTHLVIEARQLETVYRAVHTYIQCGTTAISLSSIAMPDLLPDQSILQANQIDHQYTVISSVIPRLTIGECSAGHRAENKEKSRDILLQPPERARPYLRTFDLNEDSDFINAIYVNGYSGHNQFILGQWPVRSSINDFWRLVLDDHIAVTIVLHDAQSSRRNFPTFWPTAHCTSARYGPVRVTAVRNTDTSEYTIKTFSIRKYVWNPAESFLSKDCFIMQLIFLKSWPENDDLPKNWTSLVNLIDLTQKWTQKNGKAVRPAFIMSKDGIHRAGLYCSLSLCVEQLSKDGEVDVFNAVRNVKYNRPDLVNKVEFECLYSIVTKHIMHKYLAVADESSMISQGLQATAKEEFEMLQYMASVYGINSSRSQIHNAPLSR